MTPGPVRSTARGLGTAAVNNRPLPSWCVTFILKLSLSFLHQCTCYGLSNSSRSSSRSSINSSGSSSPTYLLTGSGAHLAAGIVLAYTDLVGKTASLQ